MTTIHFDAAATAANADKPAPKKEVAQTTIEKLLASTNVSKVPLAKGKVIVVDSKLSPGEGFKLLMDNNILGAPVYDAAHNKYLGFLDVRDLVDLVVHRFDTAHNPVLSAPAAATTHTAAASTSPSTAATASSSGSTGASHTLHVESANALPAGAHLHTAKPASGHPMTAAVAAGPVSAAAGLSAAASSASAKAKDNSKVSAFIEELLLTGEVMVGAKMTVSYLSRRHPFRAVSTDATLLDVAKQLCGESHRVPVVDSSTQRVVNIISQSSLIEFLRQHLPALTAETAKSVDDWKLGSVPVLSVRDNARAIDAFRVMSEKHMSGLAVVDASGVLVANTASTDLKLYLAHPNVGAQLLTEPVLDFLSQLRADDFKVTGDTRAKVPTLSVQSSASLAMVIGKLAATKQHKLFVANANKHYKPDAVISLTDLLRAVLKIAKPTPHATAAHHNPANSGDNTAAASSTAGPSHGKLGAK